MHYVYQNIFILNVCILFPVYYFQYATKFKHMVLYTYICMYIKHTHAYVNTYIHKKVATMLYIDMYICIPT